MKLFQIIFIGLLCIQCAQAMELPTTEVKKEGGEITITLGDVQKHFENQNVEWHEFLQREWNQKAYEKYKDQDGSTKTKEISIVQKGLPKKIKDSILDYLYQEYRVEITRGKPEPFAPQGELIRKKNEQDRIFGELYHDVIHMFDTYSCAIYLKNEKEKLEICHKPVSRAYDIYMLHHTQSNRNGFFIVDGELYKLIGKESLSKIIELPHSSYNMHPIYNMCITFGPQGISKYVFKETGEMEKQFDADFIQQKINNRNKGLEKKDAWRSTYADFTNQEKVITFSLRKGYDSENISLYRADLEKRKITYMGSISAPTVRWSLSDGDIHKDITPYKLICKQGYYSLDEAALIADASSAIETSALTKVKARKYAQTLLELPEHIQKRFADLPFKNKNNLSWVVASRNSLAKEKFKDVVKNAFLD